MKIRRNYILTIAAIILTPAILLISLSLWNRHIVAEAHRTLQREGIRTKPAQFNFLVPNEFQERGLAVLRGDIQLGQTLRSDVMTHVLVNIGFHSPTNSAVRAIWKSNHFTNPNPWPSVHKTLEENRAAIDAAWDALSAGEFGFGVKASDGIGIKVGHAQHIPAALQTFNLCIVANLHEGRLDAAWTNVLAATRCVTAWKVEPTAYAQKARFPMVAVAATGIWQALQAHVWSESQLSELEREWTKVDFFSALPEAVEFYGASLVDALKTSGPEMTGSNLTIRDLVDQPKEIPRFLKDYMQMATYRRSGLYDDQRDVLFYYRDRLLEVRRAIKAESFAKMLSLPGMTNRVPFVSRHNSFVPSFITYDLFSIVGTVRGGSLGWLGYAAEAEMHRRLILAAIFLEKQRVRTGSYPQTLDGFDLPDFADGQKLRYRVTPDGRFLLYSVGLDCVDNNANPGPASPSRLFGIPKGIDIVWPMPEW